MRFVSWAVLWRDPDRLLGSCPRMLWEQQLEAFASEREPQRERERDRSLYRQMALNDALQHANLPFGSVPGTSSESNRRYGFAWAAAKVGTRLSWLSLDVCGMFWIQFLEPVQHVQKVFSYGSAPLQKRLAFDPWCVMSSSYLYNLI